MSLAWLIGLRTAFVRDSISLLAEGFQDPKMVLFTGHDNLHKGK